MCAGVHPQQTNICFEYQFKPEGRTFRPWLCRPLALAQKIVPPRYLRFAATAWIRMTSRAAVPRRTALVGNMPFDRLPLFEYAEQRLQTDGAYLSVPTIYDLLRANQQRFLYYGFARPKRGFETLKRLYSTLMTGDLLEADRTMVAHYLADLPRYRPDFAHLHFSACDWIGHRFGPDSAEVQAAIRGVDALVEQVHHEALRHYKTVRMLITADHGMVNVVEHHNLDAQVLQGLPYAEPDDYIAFRDSTAARFWFFKPAAEQAVRKRLQDIPWGTIIDDDAKRRYRIDFADNANGDLIFLLNPGVVLMPNYYQGDGAPPKGMHGYDPDVPDNQGAILIHNEQREFAEPVGATLDLVDVFPTLLDLHGLPRGGVEGRSVLTS